MKYLTPEEIKGRNSELGKLQQYVSWGIRNGRALKLVNQYISNKESKILECSSGKGEFLLRLSADGYKNITGTDIDDYRAEEAKKFEFKKVDLCFDPLPWTDNSFDGVVSLQTIEHLENPHHFIREVSRVLKPGGFFILSMPNPMHILSRLLFLWRGDLYHWLEGDNHITFFTNAIFKKAFLKNFKLVKTEYAKPEFKYGFFFRWQWFRRFLPENRAFGRYVYFVLQKESASK